MRHNTKELKKVYSAVKRYLPVVGVSLLVLLSVIAGGAIYTQPTHENQYGSVTAQSGPPVVWGGALTATEGVHAFNDPGEELWNYAPAVTSIDVSANNSIVYHGGESTIYVRDADTGEVLDTISLGGFEVRGVAVDEYGEYLYAGNGNSDLYKIDLSNNSVVWTTSLGSDEITNVDVNNDGSRIVVASGSENMIRLLNTEGDTLIGKDVGARATAVGIHPTKEIYYGVTNGSSVKAWDFSGAELFTVAAPGTVVDMKVSPKGNYVGVAAGDEAELYNSQNGSLLVNVPPESGSGSSMQAVAPGEDVFFIADEASIYAHDIETGDTLYTAHEYSGGEGEIAARNPTDLVPPPQITDPELVLETRNYIKHGNSTPYSVIYTDPQTAETRDVTDNSSLNVTSSNTSVFTLDETNNLVVATSDTSINQRETFTAEYEGLTQTENVTVANATVENLAILPGITRVQATYTDSNIILILVGTMLGVVATRYASSFAGLGAFQLTLVAGFFVDLISLGVVLVGLFAALFIGLNMAANIDYTVRR